MRKNHRGQRPESDEPLSAGRVEYLEQARARVRARRLRRTALIVAVLTAVVLFTTGPVSYIHFRAHETKSKLAWRLAPEKINSSTTLSEILTAHLVSSMLTD